MAGFGAARAETFTTNVSEFSSRAALINLNLLISSTCLAMGKASAMI